MNSGAQAKADELFRSAVGLVLLAKEQARTSAALKDVKHNAEIAQQNFERAERHFQQARAAVDQFGVQVADRLAEFPDVEPVLKRGGSQRRLRVAGMGRRLMLSATTPEAAAPQVLLFSPLRGELSFVGEAIGTPLTTEGGQSFWMHDREAESAWQEFRTAYFSRRIATP